jgi:hypothetical protein
MTRTLILALGLACAASLAHADAESRYAEASALYEKGQYAEAEGAFRSLIHDEGARPASLMGLGNSAFRRGDAIGATYAYEWGTRLAPGDDDLGANLAIARSKLVADHFPSAGSENAVKARAALARVPGRVSLIVALAAWNLGFLLLAARLRGRLESLTWLGVLLLLLALPGFAHAAWQRNRQAGRVEGILQSPEVAVRSGPGEAGYEELFDLHAGTVVQALDERPGWRRVRLPNEAEGWVKSTDLAIFGDVTTLAER